MTDNPQDRGYYWLSQAWYADANLRNADYVDEVMFGLYPEDGGTSGEMGVRWYALGKAHGNPTPQLQSFNDSWAVLAQFSDVILKMAQHDSEDIQPEQFCELLKSCGFRDLTPRTRKGK